MAKSFGTASPVERSARFGTIERWSIAFSKAEKNELVEELDRVVSEIEALSGGRKRSLA